MFDHFKLIHTITAIRMAASIKKFCTILILVNFLSPDNIIIPLQPMPFKCIFDPGKTIFDLIPGHLVIQQQIKHDANALPKSPNTEPSSLSTLQPMDCFIIVVNKSLIDNEYREIRVSMLQHTSNKPEDKFEHAKMTKQSEVTYGMRIRWNKLKRLKHSEDGTETPIQYRSIKEDKELRTLPYTKTTKVVKSHKVSVKKDSEKYWEGRSENQIPYNSVADGENPKDSRPKRTVHLEGVTKEPIHYRSIDEDKELSSRKYEKTTKIIKSHKVSEKMNTNGCWEDRTEKKICHKSISDRKDAKGSRQKLTINRESGTEGPIRYRSIEEDKELSKIAYPKITKLVQSKKTSEVTEIKRSKVNRLLNLEESAEPTIRSRPVLESKDIDRLVKPKDEPSTKARRNENQLNGKDSVLKESAKGILSIDSENFNSGSWNSEILHRKKFKLNGKHLLDSIGNIPLNKNSVVKKPLQGNHYQSFHTFNEIPEDMSTILALSKINSPKLLKRRVLYPWFINIFENTGQMSESEEEVKIAK